MVEGKGSTLVYLLVVVLSLVAFGFSIAAERRRSVGTGVPVRKIDAEFLCFQNKCVILVKSVYYIQAPYIYPSIQGHIERDAINATYCVYNSDVATGYGVGAFLFLLSSESLLMGVTKCMCFGRPLAPGGNRAWSIIYFVSSWATFLVAEACLVAGAKSNAYHTKYRGMIYAQNFSCESLRKGVFIAGAVFVIATMILNVYYYIYFSKAITSATQAAQKTKRANSTVGMTGYA